MIPATSPEEREALAKLEGMGPLAQEIIRKCDTLRAAVQAIERESKLHEKFVKAFDGKTAEQVIAAAEAQQAVGQQDPKVVGQKVEPGAVEVEEKTTIPQGMAQPATPTFTAPKALRELTRWVCRKDSKGAGGKATNGKTPCDTIGRTHVPPRAEEGEDLTWKDPDFWMDFDRVVRAYERRPDKLAGIGFIITKDESLAHDQQIVGVDIDACRNPEKTDKPARLS